MATRASMVDLIARIRTLIVDASGATEVFTDEEIERALDDNRHEVRYAELQYIESIAPGGAVTYLRYHANLITTLPWEKDAEIVDGSFNVITPSSVDYNIGVWTLSESKTPPIYLNGKFYDIYAAAGYLLTEWAGKVKLQYDVSSDDQKFLLSQKQDKILMQAENMKKYARPRVATGMRSDSWNW